MKNDQDDWWLPAIGAVTTGCTVASLILVSAGGWEWYAAFLNSQAANWFQGFGSIAAILAAYKMGQRQIETSRQIEIARERRLDVRKLAAVDAILETLQLHLNKLQLDLEEFEVPTATFGTKELIGDAIFAVRAINYFEVPLATAIPKLALLNRLAESLLDTIKSYDDSFDRMEPDRKKYRRSIWNGLGTILGIIDHLRGEIKKSNNLEAS